MAEMGLDCWQVHARSDEVDGCEMAEVMHAKARLSNRGRGLLEGPPPGPQQVSVAPYGGREDRFPVWGIG